MAVRGMAAAAAATFFFVVGLALWLAAKSPVMGMGWAACLSAIPSAMYAQFQFDPFFALAAPLNNTRH